MSSKRRGKSQKSLENKRRKISDGKDTKFHPIIDQIKQLDNGNLALQFLQIPSKKYYPDYFKEVTNPISLNEIEQNLDNYSSTDDFIEAFQLMANNAIKYNGKESKIAQDAIRIKQYAEDQVSGDDDDEDEEEDEDEEISFADYRNNLLSQEKSIIEELISHKVRGRKIAEIFMEEPSREIYPQYYDIVQQATGFNTVLKQIDSDQANTIDSFVDIVQLIFDNAKLFNQEGSQVYADAAVLEKLFHNKLEKLKSSMQQPEGYQDWLEREDEEDDGEDDEENDDDEDDEDPSQNEEEEEQDKEAIRGERLKHIVDEERRRGPGKTIEDALILGVNMTSMVPTGNPNQQRRLNSIQNDAPPAGSMSNLFQLSFPASKTHTVQSYAISLPTYHHTVNVSVVMHESLHNRIYNLMVHHNGMRRVVPVSSSTVNPWSDISQPLTDRFEIRLQPGLNKIDVVLQAGPVQRGPVRHVTQQLPQEGREEEKYTLWVTLGKQVMG